MRRHLLRVLVVVPLVMAGAATAPGPAPGSPRQPELPHTYRWPLAGVPAVTRPFQPPPRPWLPGHRGVDLGSAPGAGVFAAGDGVVAFAGTVAGVEVVSIDHAGGLRTTYEPVVPSVHVGQPVEVGQPIGTLAGGHPGCPVAACLHWGLRRGADYLDPLLLLHTARVRLLPLATAGVVSGSRQRNSFGSPSASRSYSCGRL